MFNSKLQTLHVIVFQVIGIRTGISKIQKFQTSIHQTRVLNLLFKSPNLGVALKISVFSPYSVVAAVVSLLQFCNGDLL